MRTYTSTKEAPAILASIIKMGLTTATADETTKLAALNKFTASLGENGQKLATNIWIPELVNKVLWGEVFKTRLFENPFTKAFFKDDIIATDRKEIIGSRELGVVDFKPHERYPKEQTFSDTLQVQIAISQKKKITNTIPVAGLRAGFASDMAYGEWVSEQTKLLSSGIQLHLWDNLRLKIAAMFKNEIDLTTSTTLEDVFLEMNKITADMQYIPTNGYNMGYTRDEIKKNPEKTKRHITRRKDIYIMAHPALTETIDIKLKAIKFHNSYFNVDSYAGVIPVDLGPSYKDKIILCSKKALQGWFRVRETGSQYWPNNLTLEYFGHIWYAFGNVPWDNGVVLKLKPGLYDTSKLVSA